MNKLLLIFTICLFANIYAKTYNPNGQPGTITLGFSSNAKQDGSYRKRTITFPIADAVTFKYISLRNYEKGTLALGATSGASLDLGNEIKIYELEIHLPIFEFFYKK